MKEVGEGTSKDILIYALEFWFKMSEFGNKHHQLTQMSWVSNQSYHICFGLLVTSFIFREGVGLEDNTDLHFPERKAPRGEGGWGWWGVYVTYTTDLTVYVKVQKKVMESRPEEVQS